MPGGGQQLAAGGHHRARPGLLPRAASGPHSLHQRRPLSRLDRVENARRRATGALQAAQTRLPLRLQGGQARTAHGAGQSVFVETAGGPLRTGIPRSLSRLGDSSVSTKYFRSTIVIILLFYVFTMRYYTYTIVTARYLLSSLSHLFCTPLLLRCCVPPILYVYKIYEAM